MLPAVLLTAALAQSPAGDADLSLGPPPTRNMLSILQGQLVYEPQSPVLTGVGRWQASLQLLEASTMEYSDRIADIQTGEFGGRNRMDPAFFAYLAAIDWYTSRFPFMYYFDEELTRAAVQVRTGIGPRTDLFLQAAVHVRSGGFLDEAIERFHAVGGFNNVGRERVQRGQVVNAWILDGQVAFDSQDATGAKAQDPVLGVVHELHRSAAGRLSLVVSVKPPLTTLLGTFKAGWDAQAALSGQVRRGRNTFFYGAGYTHRGSGNAPQRAFGFTSDLGAHLGWRGRGDRTVQPFFQLYWLSGFARRPAISGFHKASVQHDLGLDWRLSRATALTFRYVNNLSGNGNTDDVQLGLGLTTRY